mgnify:FL=1
MLSWSATHATALGLLCLVYVVPLVSAAKDFYDILGVKPRASERDIKSAYRKKARDMHPDKHPDKAEAFMDVSEAYQILSDPELRRIYDARGADAALQHQARKENGHADPFDAFRQFFGGGGGSGHMHDETPKGPNKMYDAEVSLKDLYLGRSFTVAHKRHVVCPACFGSGAHSTSDIHTCKACDGQGMQLHRQQIMPGFVTTMQVTCPHCNGEGRVIKRQCSRCKGHTIVPDVTDIEVEVEPGAREGAEYVFEGLADQSPDADPGDVVVKVYTTTSPGDFRRMGHNLYYTHTISLHDALLGFEHTLPHYDGHAIRLARTTATQPGHVSVIHGEGLPIPDEERRHSEDHGDLFVEFQVIVPEIQDKKTRKALSSLLQPKEQHQDL